MNEQEKLVSRFIDGLKAQEKKKLWCFYYKKKIADSSISSNNKENKPKTK